MLYIGLCMLPASRATYGGSAVIESQAALLGDDKVVYCPWTAVDIVENAMGKQMTQGARAWSLTRGRASPWMQRG